MSSSKQIKQISDLIRSTGCTLKLVTVFKVREDKAYNAYLSLTIKKNGEEFERLYNTGYSLDETQKRMVNHYIDSNKKWKLIKGDLGDIIEIANSL